jgi:hypothetical protein
VLLEEVTTSGPGLVSPDFDNTYTTTYGAREPRVVLSEGVTTPGPGLASPDFDNTYTMAYGIVCGVVRGGHDLRSGPGQP